MECSDHSTYLCRSTFRYTHKYWTKESIILEIYRAISTSFGVDGRITYVYESNMCCRIGPELSFMLLSNYCLKIKMDRISTICSIVCCYKARIWVNLYGSSALN